MPKSWHQVHARSDGLGSRLVRLESELADKAAYASRLETLLAARTARCDALADQVAQLRAANARLDAEAEMPCEMVRLS